MRINHEGTKSAKTIEDGGSGIEDHDIACRAILDLRSSSLAGVASDGENPMPTVLRVGPYRFFFYSGDCAEPPHIHVERDAQVAKFWLDPVRLQKSGGFSAVEINRIQKLVEQHEVELLRSWNEHCHG